MKTLLMSVSFMKHSLISWSICVTFLLPDICTASDPDSRVLQRNPIFISSLSLNVVLILVICESFTLSKPLWSVCPSINTSTPPQQHGAYRYTEMLPLTHAAVLNATSSATVSFLVKLALNQTSIF